jgi:hypothetical protein
MKKIVQLAMLIWFWASLKSYELLLRDDRAHYKSVLGFILQPNIRVQRWLVTFVLSPKL